MKLTSLRQRVEALPPEQRELAMSLYTEVEWRNRWDLNAWPHQIPPQDDEWRVWTIIGPPATGKTTAGIMWVKSLLDSSHDVGPGREIFALLPTQAERDRTAKLFVEDYDREGRRRRHDLYHTSEPQPYPLRVASRLQQPSRVGHPQSVHLGR
jgi:hypothetical protein